MVIGIFGVVVLTRMIGPDNYGRYAATLGLIAYFQSLFTWGINVYLIRAKTDHDAAVFDQAFTLLLMSGVTATAIGFLLVGPLEHWARIPNLRFALGSMLLVLPFQLTATVALAKLERELKYREVAAIELGGQIAYYAAALPLAMSGRLALAPFIGWMTQHLLVSLSYFIVAGYFPRIRWDRATSRDMLSYGFGYSATIWLWQLRLLVNPLVVGRFVGLDAVAVVALTVRLVEYLTFVKAAAWRISMAALGRLQSDLARMRSAIATGMMLQVLAVGPILVAFTIVSSWVVPRLFGPEWTPTVALFPFIALSYLANSVYNLHCSALYALGRNWAVAQFHVVHVLLFFSSALILVREYGVIGYGLAELVALASYLVVEINVRRIVGTVAAAAALAWATSFAVALFHHQLGLLALVGLVVAGALARTREPMAAVVSQLVRSLHEGRQAV